MRNTLVPTDVEIPEIQPDFSAPFFPHSQPARRLAVWREAQRRSGGIDRHCWRSRWRIPRHGTPWSLGSRASAARSIRTRPTHPIGSTINNPCGYAA